MKSFRCPECGGEVRPVAKAGRITRYGAMELEVPATIQIPTCSKCGEEYIDAKTASLIDAAAEPLYRSRLRTMAKDAIEALTQKHEQKLIEKILDLSHGYLSHLRSGKRTPTAELVANLTMLARHPSQVKEIESLWSRSTGRRKAS